MVCTPLQGLDPQRLPLSLANVVDDGLGFQLGLLLTDGDFFFRLASEFCLQHQNPDNLSYYTPSSREKHFSWMF
jgi:hypothetical protein